MKKLVLSIIIALVAVTAIGQKVHRPVEIRTTELGNQKMEYVAGEYVLLIKTGHSAMKYVTVPLGNKEQALKILCFLRDTKFKSGDIIELENSTGTLAKFNGLKQFIFYSEGKQFSGQMAKRYVKGYIEAIEAHDEGGSQETE